MSQTSNLQGQHSIQSMIMFPAPPKTVKEGENREEKGTKLRSPSCLLFNQVVMMMMIRRESKWSDVTVP